MKTPQDGLCVALDVGTEAEAMMLVVPLVGKVGWVKVATTLFTRTGPGMVRTLTEMGFKVFLDLKLHDIPAQVRGAAKAAAETGAQLLTVHAFGSIAMLQAAVEGAREGSPDPDNPCRVLAVTVLTTLDDQDLAIMNVNATCPEQVQNLANIAFEAGVDGIVCSAQETAELIKLYPDAFIVNPAIRFPKARVEGDDQKRVMGPVEAVAAGASLLVVGRPIRNAEDPPAEADRFVGAIEEGLEARAA